MPTWEFVTYMFRFRRTLPAGMIATAAAYFHPLRWAEEGPQVETLTHSAEASEAVQRSNVMEAKLLAAQEAKKASNLASEATAADRKSVV